MYWMQYKPISTNGHVHLELSLQYTLNAKCKSFAFFAHWGGNRETFTPENGLILLNFKVLIPPEYECTCNTRNFFPSEHFAFKVTNNLFY